MTETTWIRNRRKDVDDHVSARHSDEILDDDGTDSCWGNTHEKEAKLQAEGRLKRKVQALRDGVLLPSEADQELEDYIQRMKVPLAANQLTTKEKNKNILYAGPKRPSFLDEDTGGRHVMAFVCQGAGTAAQKARDLGMQIVHDPGLANIILAKSFKSIPEIVLLCAVLRGCYIMDAAALDGCARSLCCKLCPTTQLKRKVWVSADFKEDHAVVSNDNVMSVFFQNMPCVVLIVCRPEVFAKCSIFTRTSKSQESIIFLIFKWCASRRTTRFTPCCDMLWMSAPSSLGGTGWTLLTSACRAKVSSSWL